jgi:hypothetical protein
VVTINVPQAYTNAFNNITANGFTAVIVSADPWFKLTSKDLVTAANVWATGGRRVCYPLQDYQTEKPNLGHTTLYGPSLGDAYTSLGQLAAYVLDPVNNPNPPPPLQQIIKDI